MFRTSSHGSRIRWVAHSLVSWLNSPELRICVVQISNGVVMKRCTREEGRALQDGRGCGVGDRWSAEPVVVHIKLCYSGLECNVSL
ncbi:hypothetical protein Hamer_G007957 [Homarus americanus]|uniref:Uncharacterized protein n=1 Tax=Homarus americanus TaxID=6706 RepID=A0A8J5JPW9_HOMAM|nr:hypothetical protein Hamer_G007957 [Homarus americanus]